MRVSRHHKGGEAIHVYELDQAATSDALEAIRSISAVSKLRSIPRVA
jgi:hypothetical protein